MAVRSISAFWLNLNGRDDIDDLVAELESTGFEGSVPFFSGRLFPLQSAV